MRSSTILGSVGAMLMLAGCAGIGGTQEIDGSGTIVMEARDVSGFDSVALWGEGDVVVIQGADEYLTIETDDNLLAHIETVVEGDTLRIRTIGDATDLDPSRGITYRVGMTDITELELKGAGTFASDRVVADDLALNLTGAGAFTIDRLDVVELDVVMAGAGSVEVAGQTETERVRLTGVGSYLGADLQALRGDILLAGTGRVVVWVSDDLDVLITGSGDVDYYGNPRLRHGVVGIGHLNGLGDR